jgi:restriction system protein
MRIYPTREQFDELELDEPELEPIQCLRYLSALVSPRPYDLETVHPTRHIDLSRYKLTDDMDVIARLDSRTDLLTISPTEFEHLVRELFVAIGFKGWNTRETRDDGIDAVVFNSEPMVGGECIIQAKRIAPFRLSPSVHSPGASTTTRTPPRPSSSRPRTSQQKVKHSPTDLGEWSSSTGDTSKRYCTSTSAPT